MATSQAIIYAPQVEDMIVETIQFKSNNFVGNFSYPQSVPAYKNICKYLKNYFLAKAFSQTQPVLYQNYPREFWCTIVVDHPTSLAEGSEARPLKESNIKFTLKNGKTPLLLDYQTFCQTTGLEYNNGNYVSHPSTEEVKTELAKIVVHDVLVHKTPLLKALFPAPWRILMTFVLQVFGRNHSSTEQLNFSQQLIVCCLLTGTKIDIGEIIYNDLVTMLMAKSRQNQTKFSKNPFEVTHIELTTFMKFVINHETSVSPLTVSEKKGKKKPKTVDTTQSTQLESGSDYNKGKTSSEVELDNQPLIQTYGDFQIIMEDLEDDLKDLSDEEMYEVGEDMDD
ncbi:hypothetical protein Tco_1400403 [Tanacetum coccineum]